jgi:hypothetical protein
MPEITFIDSGPERTRQRRGLERVKALSHAARVSHAAPKAASAKPKQYGRLGWVSHAASNTNPGPHRWIVPSSEQDNYLTWLVGSILSLPRRPSQLLVSGHTPRASEDEYRNVEATIVYTDKQHFDMYRSLVANQFAAGPTIHIGVNVFQGARTDAFGFLH